MKLLRELKNLVIATCGIVLAFAVLGFTAGLAVGIIKYFATLGYTLL